MIFFRAFIFRFVICPVLLVFLTPYAALSAKGVKTSYKKYALFTYDDRAYLCEPYTVQQNEWLYKIFRQKGEISASDFPLFLKIFKTINPQIGNIDAITPGSQILIPLKQVDKNDYEQTPNGTVEVPVVEFGAQVTPDAVSRHIRKHEVKAGDTISQLLSQEFLTPKGNVSALGEQTMHHLNPAIKNINRIYQGAILVIPYPSIISQPWFSNLVTLAAKKAPPADARATRRIEEKPTAPRVPEPLSTEDLTHLKRYTQLIRGRLIYQGKLFFPPVSQGQKPECIDLSKTPVISDSTGKKTVVIGSDATEDTMGADLVAAMKSYWKDLQFKKITDILDTKAKANTPSMKDIPESQETLIQTLTAAASCTYEPEVFLPVSLDTVQMTVSLGRITHEHAADILINSGSVYGHALERLKQQGYQILDLPRDLTFEEICTRLFSLFGYQVWKDPSFNAGRKVESIPGLYAEKGIIKLFLTRKPLLKSAKTFLEHETIDVITL